MARRKRELICGYCRETFIRDRNREYCSPQCAGHVGVERKRARLYKKHDSKLKTCAMCKKTLSRSSFCRNKTAFDGLNCWCNQCSQKYRKDHPEYHNTKAIKLKKQTPTYRISHHMRSLINRSLKDGKRGRSWEDIVGYNIDTLKQHLKKRFKSGMSFHNYGEWHIDHIIPISAHNYEKTCDNDFNRCWSLENLQPLWAQENFSKGAKLNNHFQPSLVFKR